MAGDGSTAGCLRSIRCRSPCVALGRGFSCAGVAQRRTVLSTAPPLKEVAHAWSAVAARPIRPSTFPAVRVRRFGARRSGVARVPAAHVGRDRFHRGRGLRPLVDAIPVPRWHHGRRRPPDRGDGQLHRGGDDARSQSTPQGRLRGPVSGRNLQLGLATAGADAIRPRPQDRACQRHVRHRARQPRRAAHGVGRRPLDRDRSVTTTVNGPGSKPKERAATATATIVFDGNTLVDGDANFPFPAPFIRRDVER